MSSELPEIIDRPVVVVPTFTSFHMQEEGPTYPGIIHDSPGDRFAVGDGGRDILKGVSILESADITCCIVGTSALIYFGAGRGRGDWQICVPTEKLEVASLLLQSAPFTNQYAKCQPPPDIGIYSLLHTFPRFKLNRVKLWFQLVPSEDCHINCKPSNLERCKRGLPYPKLEVYTQSLLDTYNGVDLIDLVDGMNLSKDWGDEHLDLTGTYDVEWVRKKNERIRMSVPDDENACLYELFEGGMSRRKLWEEITGGKEKRLGPELPSGIYVTRFRLRGDKDPRDFE